MKKTAIFAALTSLLLVAGCSTTKISMPKQHPEKYALQVIQIEISVDSTNVHDPVPDFLTDSSVELPKPPVMEELLKEKQAVVTEFPIVYAAVGETAINDQTETLDFPDIDKPAKTGCRVETTIQKVENGTISFDLHVFNQTLQGMQKTGEASTPVFQKQSLNTQLTMMPGNWMSMGGLVSKSSNEKRLPKKMYLFLRILPPEGVPYESNREQPKPGTVYSIMP